MEPQGRRAVLPGARQHAHCGPRGDPGRELLGRRPREAVPDRRVLGLDLRRGSWRRPVPGPRAAGREEHLAAHDPHRLDLAPLPAVLTAAASSSARPRSRLPRSAILSAAAPSSHARCKGRRLPPNLAGTPALRRRRLNGLSIASGSMHSRGPVSRPMLDAAASPGWLNRHDGGEHAGVSCCVESSRLHRPGQTCVHDRADANRPGRPRHQSGICKEVPRTNDEVVATCRYEGLEGVKPRPGPASSS